MISARRQKSYRVAKIAAEVLGYRPTIELGRGTASAWVTIRLRERPTAAQRSQIVRRVMAEKLAGEHWPDDGITRHEGEPNVSFRVGAIAV